MNCDLYCFGLKCWLINGYGGVILGHQYVFISSQRYEALDDNDRFRVFEDYLKDLIRKDQEQTHLANEARRKLEKKAREVLLVWHQQIEHECGLVWVFFFFSIVWWSS